MADNDVLQVFADSRVDSRSLSEFMWKPADFIVQRRLAPPINTLQFYIDYLEGLKAVYTQQAGIVEVNGVQVKTVTQAINDAIETAIKSESLVIAGSFEVGATITQLNHAILYNEKGKTYVWTGSLPKTILAGSNPATTGGTGVNGWQEVSSKILKQELQAGGGASLIGNGSSFFSSLSNFELAESDIRYNSNVFLAKVAQNGDLENQGRLYKYTEIAQVNAINLKTKLGYLSREFDGHLFIAECGATGDDYAKDSAALQKAFDIIRLHNAGTLSMGVKGSYFIEGALKANLSDIEWQFNNSEVILGVTSIAWHPYKHGLGNYKNINIYDAVWIGNRTMRPASGYPGGHPGIIHMDFAQCDDVKIANSTYIEAISGGHYMDLMSCREVTFEHNNVLGRAATMPTSRTYTEAVQIGGKGSVQTAGAPVDPSSVEFFRDGIDTKGVYFRHNIFKPYTNPITGIKTYPPRPTGNHGFGGHKDIHVHDNYFDNITSLVAETYNYHQAVLQLSGVDNIIAKDNVFISNESPNTQFVSINGYGAAASECNFSVTNNTIRADLAPDVTFVPTPTPIFVLVTTGAGEGHAKKININVDDNKVDMKVANMGGNILGAGIVVSSKTNVNDISISKNTLHLEGGFKHHIITYDTTRGGSELFEGNILSGLLLNFSIKASTSNNTKVTLKSNVFIDQWRSIYAASPNNVNLLGNILDGFSEKSFDGFITKNSESDGGKHTIIVYGNPIISSGNVLINETRATPIRIGGSTEVRPESEFLIKNSTTTP